MKDSRKSKLDQEILNEISEKQIMNESCHFNLNQEFNPFGKKFSEIAEEVKEKSPFRNFHTYSVII